MISVLDVYLHNRLIGKLTQDRVSLSFAYEEAYLKDKNAVPLSVSMPLTQSSFTGSIVASFFSGLLPDEQVRVRLGRYLGISARNTFALLREIGGDCAGALSLFPEGVSPLSQNAHSFRVLSDTEAWDILSHLDKHPMLAGEEGIRMSGAGAQDKLMIAFVGNNIAIPTENTPSTHIIKPQIKGIEFSVQNEFFCMRLARKVGLSVPEARIFSLNGEVFYLVKRYDRRIEHDGRATRLHQEDFCQALYIAPEQKYENEGGPTLQMCFSLLDEKIKSGFMAGIHKVAFLRAVIFNYLIGNGDAHGKNFSLLYEGQAQSLAPLYDLMCTLVYDHSFKGKMAMKIGGKYAFQDVTLRHFDVLAQQISLKSSFVKKEIQHMCQNILPQACDLIREIEHEGGSPCEIYERIVCVIEKNVGRLKNLTLTPS